MRPPDRITALGGVALAVAVAAAVALREELALPPAVLVGAVLVLAVVVVAGAVTGVRDLAVVLLALGIATSSWNAVAVGPLKLAHPALAVAGVVLGILAVTQDRPVRAPAWTWLLGATITVVTAAAVLWPVSGASNGDRNLAGIEAAAVATSGLAHANLVTGLQWVVAVVVLPLLVALAVQDRPDMIRRLAVAWTLGVVVNALAALCDELQLTHINTTLRGLTDYSGRQAGLTVQPNHLAVAIVLALPIATWCLVHAGRRSLRAVWLGADTVLTAALVTTGSRGGFVAAVVVVAAVLALDPRSRRLVPVLAAVVGVVAVAVAVATPTWFSSAGEQLRLVGTTRGAEASDALRSGLTDQALIDIDRSPLRGIGPVVADQAHDIYLQLAASGGAILLVGFVLAQFGFLTDAWALRHRADGLALAVGVSGTGLLIVGVVENTITDIYLYVPFALLAGVWAAARERIATPVERPLAVPEREEIHS